MDRSLRNIYCCYRGSVVDRGRSLQASTASERNANHDERFPVDDDRLLYGAKCPHAYRHGVVYLSVHVASVCRIHGRQQLRWRFSRGNDCEAVRETHRHYEGSGGKRASVRRSSLVVDIFNSLLNSGCSITRCILLNDKKSISVHFQPHVQTLVKNYRIVDEDYLVDHSKTHDVGFCVEQSEYGHFVPSSFVDVEASTMLQKLKDNLYWETVAALVTKTCPFKQPFNDLIMKVKQTGVQHYWELQVRVEFHTDSGIPTVELFLPRP